ncbi:A/G-specific adenine glycosylase [Calidifontibacillus oryziterrae]|uniref:A/G-specific adenine glycosylase n=1 Tax=Calidifontibacillus oryziterrae TaxID=1191699 RepID=UPI0002FAFAEA|nr:A/G-specific adenine glycosylase [Calidifontibacillus oryziterrae]
MHINLKNFNKHKFQNDLITWFLREQRDLPWRIDKDPYKIWVSEIMLQQTRVETVIPYYKNFLEKFPTIEALAEADEDQVIKAWEGLGYYSRARNLQAAVKEVVSEYGGKVPNNVEEISKLKGVGPYTQGAILSIAYGIPEPAVDGNVMRVLSRILSLWDDIAKPKTRKIIESVIREIISHEQPSEFNQGLMELGAIVCTPKSPSCLLCPVQQHCLAFQEGVQDELPIKSRKKAIKDVVLIVGIIKNDEGKILIRKRPNTGLLANLWEFPNFEMGISPVLLSQQEQLVKFINDKYRVKLKGIDYVMNLKHEFSHLLWDIAVYRGATTSKFEPTDNERFVYLHEVSEYAFPVSFQKIIEKLKIELNVN